LDGINKIYKMGRQADFGQEGHESHEGKPSFRKSVFMSFMFLLSDPFP